MNAILQRVRAEWNRRAWWMNGLMLFCVYMAVFYVPRDFLTTDIDVDAEVWLGVRLHGIAAKATEPLHFAIYAAGTWGFYRMRSWMWPWASVYAAQVAISMCVWALLYVAPDRGLQAALVSGGIGATFFGVIAVALWRARHAFVHS